MRPKAVTPRLLRRRPLPLDTTRGKEGRGVVLIIGGAASMPGAIVLTATAALRAGAGKLQIATAGSVATPVGIAMPEAYVIAVEELRTGGLRANAAPAVAERAAHADALVIGPGMVDEAGSIPFVAAVLAAVDAPVALDALALGVLGERPAALAHLRGRVVLTPHCGEMAQLFGCDRAAIEGDAATAAREAARRFGAVVALKDRDTHIAAPDGTVFRYRGGTAGLATSGSGDVLAGAIGGLLARGADPLTATLWGVAAHATAGAAITDRIGIGLLARELPGALPAAFRQLEGRRMPRQ